MNKTIDFTVNDMENMADMIINTIRTIDEKDSCSINLIKKILSNNIFNLSDRAYNVSIRSISDHIPSIYSDIVTLNRPDNYRNKTTPLKLTNEEINFLARMSVQYAVGRRTYITSEVSDLILEIVNYLTEDTTKWIIDYINSAESLGDACDAECWHRLVKYLIREEV